MLEIAQYLFEIDEAAVLASPKKEKKMLPERNRIPKAWVELQLKKKLN